MTGCPARQFGSSEAPPTLLFDPEGEVQGVVWTPPGLEVESIGEDFSMPPPRVYKPYTLETPMRTYLDFVISI